MNVRAKFKVVSKSAETNGGYGVTLSAVYDPDPSSENGQFFRWTPFGCITMGVVSEETAKQFVEGEEMYVDFTPVPKG